MVIVNATREEETNERVVTRTQTTSVGTESQDIEMIRKMVLAIVAATVAVDGTARNHGGIDIARLLETIARSAHGRSALLYHIAPAHLAANANLPENKLF
jgi:hypothetical protein